MRFHDLRHTHKTWMIEDHIPEIAQSDRLGHTIHGIRGVYSHTTDMMTTAITNNLQQRWTAAIGANPDGDTPRAA
jgi:integrase